MRRFPVLLAASLCIAGATVRAAPVDYVLDPGHTQVLFSWNHFGFSHPTAEIGLGEGKIAFDPQRPTASSVEVSLPLAKLDTHVPALDKRLKAPDFFDAAKYPVVTFRSTQITSLEHGRFRIVGDLRMHGVTKPVQLTARLNKLGPHPMWKKAALGFDACGLLKRSDFGLGAYAPGVSDELRLRITVEGEVAQ